MYSETMEWIVTEHTYPEFKIIYVCGMEFLRKNTMLFLIASLTLGLAPFNPPHIWGKLQWITGGGAFSGESPMQAQDWFDVLLHGTPWILLILGAIAHGIKLVRK